MILNMFIFPTISKIFLISSIVLPTAILLQGASRQNSVDMCQPDEISGTAHHSGFRITLCIQEIHSSYLRQEFDYSSCEVFCFSQSFQ
jgi:hypothetical protein